MRVQHPVAKAEDGVVDDAVYVAGDEVPIDDDGTFEVPEQARSWLSDWAAGYGMEPDDLIVTQEDPPPDEDTEFDTLPFNPDAHTVAELSDKVADVDDESVVQALRNREVEQQNRTTALDAFDARLADLEG